MSFYTVIQMRNQTALYWFSTYWFRASYPFRPLIHSALIDSDVAKQPPNVVEMGK
ncbi:hypothetical protein HanXRQr2_Chr04g0188801 [Helianthus annuus]|uniref:Uncharacterized protein n=1 Tax=Helianthus annuus TaxID=4232 RepID=A0A9K3JC25_HELAN|nr:hypothetical protein HanXRQr2_Chr04g0188801 [Helianthus annuus]